MARRNKERDNIPDLPAPVELSDTAKEAYGAYWTALASAGDVSESQNFTRGLKGQGGENSQAKFPLLATSQQPFRRSGGFISAYDILDLCVKAYWCQGFALWRVTVEKMVELANSDIILTGSSKKTKQFVYSWLKAIHSKKFSSMYLREYWRSANVIILRLMGKIREEDLKSLDSLYSGLSDQIPLKYHIVEPRCILAADNLNFGSPTYYRRYSPEEIALLKAKDKTPENKAIYDALPEASKDALKRGNSLIVPLDPSNLIVHLAKNQNYEPFAVPMIWNALQQVEMKLALQNMDKIIAQMGERLFLLVNVGMKNDEHNKTGMNYNTMAQLQTMFNSGAVQRVLVVDFTVEMEWITLPINELLSAEKYKQVDKDLMIALNAIFFDANEKFANTSIKVNIFVETLKEARSSLLKFYQDEIDLLCKKINAKTAPKISFSEIDLRDQNQYERFIQSMAGIGLLTPEEVFQALDVGKLPDKEESLESQREFKILKEEGLYQPLVGNSVALQEKQLEVTKELGVQQIQQKAAQQKAAGRPTGTKAPQTKKKSTPIGGAEEDGELKYSFSNLKDLIWEVSALEDKVQSSLKKKHKLKQLDAAQLEVSKSIVESITSNEERENWDASVKTYIKELKEVNAEIREQNTELSEKLGISTYNANLLRLSAIQ